MNIFVVNAGSSSIKCDLYDGKNAKRLSGFHIDKLNSDKPLLKMEIKEEILQKGSMEELFNTALSQWKQVYSFRIDAIAHRVVHGGHRLFDPVLIDEQVKKCIQETFSLAPLHNPINFKAIEVSEKFFQNVPQIAVFDTGFHSTMPRRAKLYALPKDLNEKYNIRRYGFHGISHQYVAKKAAEYLNLPLKQLRIITCHLGNGCSVCAVEYGCSVETSTGRLP